MSLDRSDRETINAPSLSALFSGIRNALVQALIGSAVFAVLLRFTGTVGSGTTFLGLFTAICILALVLCAAGLLAEPMLVLRHDGFEVIRWMTVLTHVGTGRDYPWQRLTPVEVVLRGGRGAPVRVRRIAAYDRAGNLRTITFRLISLSGLQTALGQSQIIRYG